MCSKRSEIFFKGIEIVIIFIFPCRTQLRQDVEVQVAAAKYYFKSKEKMKILTEKLGIMDNSKNRYSDWKIIKYTWILFMSWTVMNYDLQIY